MTRTARTGNGQRKSFETKEAAESFVRERTAETKAYGVHFTTIPPTERAALMYQLQRLDGLGWTLIHAPPTSSHNRNLHALWA